MDLKVEQTKTAENGLYKLFNINCALNSQYISGQILTASVKVEDVSTGKNVANLPYDVAFSTTDELAKSWTVNGGVVATGNTFKLYACGTSIKVIASTNIASNNNTSIVGVIL